MAKERTWLDAMNDGEDLLCDVKDRLASIARALHFVGNDKLADKIATEATDIAVAVKSIREGRDMMLSAQLGYVNAADSLKQFAVFSSHESHEREKS